MSFQTITLV